MQSTREALSRALTILGGLMILAGMGWGLWTRFGAAPEPEISDLGAVVLAETAPAPISPTTAPSPSPAEASAAPPAFWLTPAGEGPTPELLPEWPSLPEPYQPTATPSPLAVQVTARPTSTPTPIPSAASPPARIVAPSIDLDARVVPMTWEMVDRKGRMVSEWVVPKDAAGWHVNSAMPGQGDNVVLSGHHNIEGKVFRYVVDLSPGDEITLFAGDAAYPYMVVEKYILKEAGMPLSVRQTNAQWIMPSGDERLTLVTCWPYEWPGNTHRVIVVARPPGSFAEDDGTRE